MALVIKCSRCSKCFAWHLDAADGFAFLKHNYNMGSTPVIKKTHDLCPDCVESLRDWLERGWEEP